MSDNSNKRWELLRRYTVFLVGLFFMALGVSVMTRAQLGISPVQSLAFVVYNVVSEHITFGAAVLIWNCIMVLLQWPLLGKRFGWKQFIQIPLSFFLSGMVDATGAMLFWLSPNSVLLRVVTMLCGVLLLGFSICVTVSAGAVMNAGEALVFAISQKTKLKFGTVKELTDLAIVGTAVLLMFIFFKHWRFDLIGVGTLVSAGLTGFVVRFFNMWLKPVVECIVEGRKEEKL